jgi:hypothetical protein
MFVNTYLLFDKPYVQLSRFSKKRSISSKYAFLKDLTSFEEKL